MKRTAVGAGLLVVLVALAGVAVGGAAATTQDNGTDEEAPLGAEISSFMQASSAEAEGEVDDGMFRAALNRTDDPEEQRALVEQRQQRLQERQARLQERRGRISTDDELHPRDYALATHVEVGAARLERSANGTARAAEAAGLDTEALNEIRRNASQLGGQEVAELARQVAGPPAGERGPPGDAGNGTDSESPRSNAGPFDDRGNGSDAAEASGQSGNASERSENGSERPGDGPDRGNGPDGEPPGQGENEGADPGE